MSGQTFKVERDCFFDVGGSFHSRLTLRDATGRDGPPLQMLRLILLNQNAVLHN